jgi:hypothetical protein
MLAFDVILMMSRDITPCYDVMEFRPNFGALETAQQSKGIPEDEPPGQSGASIVGSFLSHGWIDLGGRIFLRIFLYMFHELAGFNMIYVLGISFPGKATRRGRIG